jgi:hypothetical protein
MEYTPFQISSRKKRVQGLKSITNCFAILIEYGHALRGVSCCLLQIIKEGDEFFQKIQPGSHVQLRLK